MAARPAHKGPFDAVTVSHMLANLAEKETELRDSHAKPGSVLPELLEMVRQFVVQKADDFDQFTPVPPFKRAG